MIFLKDNVTLAHIRPIYSSNLSGFCCVCHVFPPHVSRFGLFPVLVKCHYELILVQPCLSNYLWFTCVFIVLSVQFDFFWSTRYFPVWSLQVPRVRWPQALQPADRGRSRRRPRALMPADRGRYLPSSWVAAPPGAPFAGDHATGPPLTQCPPDRRWLKPAGSALTHARWPPLILAPWI